MARLRYRAITAALTIALLPTGGCSWLFVQKPPLGPVKPAPPVECTSSAASPAVDTVGAVLVGLPAIFFTVLGVALPTCGRDEACLTPTARTVVIGGGLAVAGAATALAFSAAHGYSTTAKCRELTETQLDCVSGVEAACSNLKER